MCFLLVPDEMFNSRGNATALKPVDVLGSQFPGEEWIFRERLKVSSAQRRTMQAYSWRKEDISASCFGLLGEALSDFSNESEVP